MTDQQSAEALRLVRDGLDALAEFATYKQSSERVAECKVALDALAQRIETLEEQIQQRDEHEHNYDKEIERLTRERNEARQAAEDQFLAVGNVARELETSTFAEAMQRQLAGDSTRLAKAWKATALLNADLCDKAEAQRDRLERRISNALEAMAQLEQQGTDPAPLEVVRFAISEEGG